MGGGGVVNATPRPLYTRERDPVTMYWRLCGPQLIWTGVENLVPTGIRSPLRLPSEIRNGSKAVLVGIK